MATKTDFLWTSSGGPVSIVGNVWVRAHNNDTAVDYFSSSTTDPVTGAFTMVAPAGNYSLYSGSAANVGGTSNLRNANWEIPLTSGDDAVVHSLTSATSGPYVPLAGLPAGAIAITAREVWITPSGGDDSSVLQTLVNSVSLAGGGTIKAAPGTYTVKNVNWKSNVALWAEPGTVTFKTTTASTNIIQNVTGTLDSVTIHGINFDCTGVGWSAIVFNGSDAAGQITNLLIRSCQFKNPSTTWMIQVSYIIVDPTIPTSKNSNIRIEDCTDDATGQTFTLENLILVNCQDVLILGNRFLNAPATLGAHVAVYGYNRNVRFMGNYALNFLCARAIYCENSDGVQLIGDQFRTTANVTCVTVFNSSGVSVLGCDMVTGSTGVGVDIRDFAGTTFDAHTNLYQQSSAIKVQGNRMDVMATCVSLTATNKQAQTDIFVEGNFVSPLRSLFQVTGVPASPSGTIKRLTIRNNHVISHSGFTGAGCISINGNAGAANGGIQTVTIADNVIPASGTGSGTDIEVTGLADDVWIYGNRCMSPAATAIQIVATATNVKQSNNIPISGGFGVANLVSAAAPLTGQTAAVASVAATTAPNDGPGHTYRVSGSVRIVTLGSGNINLQVTYTDDNGVGQTCNIPLCAQAGTWAASATTADDYKGSTVLRVQPNTAVTIKTAGTFTGCTYNVWGAIEQMA